MAADDPATTRTEADAVSDIQRRALEPRTITLNDGPRETEVLFTPDGQVRSIKPFLDEYLTAPERRKGTARFTSLDSLIAHVRRFADADSVIFTDDSTKPSLTAVLDYHRAGSEGAPRFGAHRAHYAFPLSEEWQRWTSAASAKFAQADFAAFLEDRIVDVIDPSQASGRALGLAEAIGADLASPSRLLSIARSFAVNANRSVAQAVNTSTGETRIEFAEDHRGGDGKPVSVPAAFLIGIPVFRSGARYQIAVRLRYRLTGSAVTWSVEMHRPDLMLADAIEEAVAKVRAETSLPVLFGAPE